jgi:hypothetical protein
LQEQDRLGKAKLYWEEMSRQLAPEDRGLPRVEDRGLPRVPVGSVKGECASEWAKRHGLEQSFDQRFGNSWIVPASHFGSLQNTPDSEP